MRRIFTLPLLCQLLVLAVSSQVIAQTTLQQRTTTRCYKGVTKSFNATTGTLMDTVNFTQGNSPGQIPVGHVVTDVLIKIEWSKTDDGSCKPTTNRVVNLGDIGFTIFNNQLGTRILAASTSTGGLIFPSTTSTFTGSTNTVATTYFRAGFPRTFPYTPTSGDTISTNGDPLTGYQGTNPIGGWSIGGIDDSPLFGFPSLCIHSYCITLVTCLPTALQAQCKAFPEVALDPITGTHTFNFADLDSLSDISCLANSISFAPNDVNCNNTGAHVPVTMTIQDNLGNTSSCTGSVMVRDTTPPVIPYCNQPLGVFTDIYLDAQGRDTFYASSITMTDNCGPITKEVRLFSSTTWDNFIPFECMTGPQQFLVQGTDPGGNQTLCRIVVDVKDTIPPTAVCAQDTLFVGGGSQTLSPINIDGGSNDGCTNFLIANRWIGSVGASSPSFNCADIGQFNVSLIVSDDAGNLDTCNNAQVTVLDTTAPTAICQNVTVYLSSAGTATLTVADVDNGSSDICSLVNRTINGVASINYNCTDANTTPTVTLRVEDPSGNVSSCTATITVLDTFPPTAICQNGTIYVNNLGIATVAASSLNNNSTDLCTGTSLTFSIKGNPTSYFDCNNIATSPNPVALMVTDSNGNSSTCTANVTVLDTLSPLVTCANPTVHLDANGLVNVTTAELTANSNDNCLVLDSSINVIGIPYITYTCAAIFTPQKPLLVIRDASGNDASCVATINVVDTTRPTALCKSTFTAVLDGNGNATVTPLNIDSASTDNCGIIEYSINKQASQVYTCRDLRSPLPAFLTITDSSGNYAECRTIITVVDNTPPIASCQISDAHLSASGTVAITPNDVLAFPATNDNCGNIVTTFAGGANTTVYNCDSIGKRKVDIVVTDGSGQISTCQTTITVIDSFAPIANCRPVPYTVQLDASGKGFVLPSNIDNSSQDICGVDTLLVNNVDSFFYDCSNIGQTRVTLSVIDKSGNTSTCNAQLLIADSISPIARCRDTTFYLGASGVITVFPIEIDAGSTDNCTFTRRINNLPSVNYNCNQVGINTAQLLITDVNGNEGRCSADITIIDTISPTANCIAPNSVTAYLDTTCFASIAASTFNNNSQDNCSGSLVFRANGSYNATFTSANLKTNPNTVVLEVCDGSINCTTCTTSVVVADTIPPRMVCRPTTVQLDGNGNAVIVPSDINGGSRDNCSVPTYTINGGFVVNFDCTNLGSNNVTLAGTDQSGNSDSCMTTVFVEDVTSPNASCNGTVTLVLNPITSLGTLTVGQVNNSSSDNCGITNFILSKTNFDCHDIANNPHSVTMVVIDQSGNRDSCTTLVTVVDKVSPNALCRSTQLILPLVGSNASITVADIDNGSNDNCALANLSLDKTTFSCADIGSKTVTLTAIDSSGNKAFCTATVVINDTTAPTSFCNNPTVQLDANGLAGISAKDLGLGSFDNCTIDTFLVGGQDSVFLSCANLGNNQVTVFMSDPSNKTATCVSTINVEDTVSPMARCVSTPVVVQLGSNGIGSITAAQVDNGSDDNCAIVTRNLSRPTFSCADVGSNQTIFLTVTDKSNNSSTCSATVTVLDTVAPNMACQPTTVNVHLGLIGTASITANLFDAGTNDSCGIANLSFAGSPNVVTCADIGIHPVTLIATDVNGNIDSCITTLTILDTVAPTLGCDTITIDLDNAGVATIDSATAGLYTVKDACGVVSITLNGASSVNYTCVDTGFNAISVIATDDSRNSALCFAGVLVRDVTKPVVTCGNSTAYLDASGNVVVNPASITAGIVEACGIDTIFTSPTAFDCNNVGPLNPVTLTVIDNSGNSSSCNGNIEILDQIAPTMVCRDTTVCLNSGFVNITPADIDGSTFDACGLSAIQSINGSNNAIFTCADIGVQTVVLQRQDVNGNSSTCQAKVTVQDCTPPTAICRGTHSTYISNNSFAIVRAIDLDFGSSDDCGIDSTTFLINGRDSLSYNCGAIGVSDTVLFTVADFAGNLDSCTVIITIQDVTAPVARCGGAITAVLSANSGSFIVPAINLNNTNNGSSDNCRITNYLINGLERDTFDCSMVGANVAVLTVIDQSGNTDTCQAIVDVRDITSPTINCRFTTNLALDATGQATLPVASVVLSASDNCGIESILSSGQNTLTFNCDSIGSNSIIIEVADSSGNIARCNAIVKVQDNIDPTAICPTLPVPVYLTSAGNVWTTAQKIDSASFDNCDIVSYQINGTDSVLYSCNQIGQFPMATLTVFDSKGKKDVCNAIIDVIDTIPPVAQCSSFTVTLNPVGQAIVGAAVIDSLSIDNCTNITLLINDQLSDTFNCSNVGALIPVSLKVMDRYNNSSICMTTIKVVDVTPPTLQCASGAVDFYLNNNGIVTVTPDQVSNAFDTCAIASWTINGAASAIFDCSAVGFQQVVTIKVEDQSGNYVRCVVPLEIKDTIPPTQGCNPVVVQLDSSGTVDVCGADLMNFNVDNCGIRDTLINGQTCMTFGCDSVPVGVFGVVLSLTDFANNTTTCTTTVEVRDVTAPIVTCDSLVVVQLDLNGIAKIAPSLLYNTVSDACGIASLSLNQDTFRCSDVNSNNPVILTVKDKNNLPSTCISVVQVEDNNAPVVSCRPDTVYLGSSGTGIVLVDSIDNGTTDPCGFDLTFSGGGTTRTFNCSDIGTQNVTMIAKDNSSNIDSCSSTVTVIDTMPPALICQSGLRRDLTNTGQLTLGLGFVLNNSRDNCGIDTTFVSPSVINCTNVGQVVFTVTAIDESGNVGFCQDTIVVTLESPTIITPTQDTVLCEGHTLPLVARAPSNGIIYDYQWKGPKGAITVDPRTTDTSVNNVTIADEGWYIFTITRQQGNGCSASDSVFLTVNDVPAPVLAGTPPCQGDTGIVYVSNASAYKGAITYNWYFNGGAISNTGDSLVIPAMANADSGSYSVLIQVAQGAAFCTDSSSTGFDFDVLDLPVAPTPTATTPCEGQMLTLLNNAPGNSYLWNGPAGFSSVQPVPTRANATTAFAGLYTLTITDANGCSSNGSVNINIRPTPPNPNIIYTQPLCNGDLLELRDTTNYPRPPVVYFWKHPDGSSDTTGVSQLFLPNADFGLYQLSVSMDGCSSKELDSVNVQYEPLPVGFDDFFSIQFRDSLVNGDILINDAPNGVGYSLMIVDSTNGGITNLDAVAGTLNYSPRSGFFGVDTLYYTLCDAQCPNSCDTVKVLIEVVTEFECYIPQGLSPNGDGINDELIVRCKNNYPNAEIKIFSRWGTLVYEGDPTGWNGQFNGKDLPDGTYFYVLDLNDTTYTGTGRNKGEGRVGDRYSGYIMLQR